MEQVTRATNLRATHQPYENWMFNRACDYVSSVLSALQVRLSYISRTRHARVCESYIGTQVESKAQVCVP